MYLETSNCYKRNIQFGEKLQIIILSRMIQLYPPLRNCYIDSMNPEEQMMFDAKVVRLERENMIKAKSIDRVYPIDWVYNFDKEIKGREFTKRCRNVVSRMREKMIPLLKQFDFENLYINSIDLLESVQSEMKTIRNSHPSYKKFDIEKYEEGILFFKKYDLVNSLSCKVYKQIYYVSQNDLDLFHSMLYLYGYLKRTKYIKLISYCKDFFEYGENNRMFSIKRMIRKYKELPCVIAYFYYRENQTIDTTLLQPIPFHQFNRLEGYYEN